MKVLIVGSYQENGLDEESKAFREACVDLGAELAKAGHTIIVGSSRENTADFHAVIGARAKYPEALIESITPKDHEIPFPGTDIPTERPKGTWIAGRIHQLRECDVAVLIGGGEKTSHAGYAAYALRKPIVPIPAFGGAAKDLWDYLEHILKHDPRLGELLKHFDHAWSQDSARRCVDVVNYVRKRNPFQKTQTGTSAYLILMLAIALAAAWACIFQFSFLPGLLQFMSLLVVASLMGVTLRAGLKLMNDVPLDTHRFSAETATGLLLAIGLAVLYMAGVLTVTGQFDMLAFGTWADFHRAGLVMSILGLFSGFQIEAGAERLAKMLSDATKK